MRLQMHQLLVAGFHRLSPILSVDRNVRYTGDCRETHPGSCRLGRCADSTLVTVVGVAVGVSSHRLELLHDRHESLESRRLAPSVEAVLGRLQSLLELMLLLLVLLLALARGLENSVRQLRRPNLT